MIRRPPRSTLFPSRRSSDLVRDRHLLVLDRRPHHSRGRSQARRIRSPAARLKRSEEHTSELQSHSDLVCRLLLEKKKKKNQTIEKTPAAHSVHASSRR